MVKNNLDVLKSVVENGFGKCNLAIFDELINDSYIEPQFAMHGGKEGLKKSVLSLHSAFPDMHYELLDSCESGDMIWVHYKASGTHTGIFMQLPPSGKKFTIDVIDRARVSDGKIIEHWGMPDRFALMHQLGMFDIKPVLK